MTDPTGDATGGGAHGDSTTERTDPETPDGSTADDRRPGGSGPHLTRRSAIAAAGLGGLSALLPTVGSAFSDISDGYTYVDGPQHGEADEAFGRPAVTGDGTVVFPPMASNHVGLYDPAANAYTRGPAHEETDRYAFHGGTVVEDGRVVFTPVGSPHVGVYDPDTDTYTSGPEHGEGGGGSMAFATGTRAADGRVVFGPFDADHVGIYDPATDTYTSGPEHGERGYAFRAATRAADGRIVFVPYRSNRVGIYDPATDTYTSGAEHGEDGEYYFAGGTTTADGTVVFAPLESSYVGLYDPATDTYTRGTEHEGGTRAFSGAVMAPDGTIVFVPLEADHVGLYDPETDTYTQGPEHGGPDLAFVGGVPTPDGNLVLSPNFADSVGILVPPSGDVPPNATFEGPEDPVVAGETVTLDATGSSDPDGPDDELAYEWDLTGDGTVDATGAVVEHAYGTAGSKPVTLTVTDGDGTASTVTGSVPVEEYVVLDSFEDGDIAEYDLDEDSYSGDDGYNVVTDPTSHGDYALQLTNDAANAFRTDVSVGQGDVIKWDLYFGGGWTEGHDVNLFFGVQDQDNYYGIRIDAAGRDDFSLVKVEGGSRTYLARGSTGGTQGEWLTLTVDWGTDGTITAEYDGTTLSATDTTYTEGGIGSGDWGNNSSKYVDNVRKTGNLLPTAAFDAAPEAPRAGGTVTFDASGSGDPSGELVAYEWEFGDGSTATGETVDHTYDSMGEYAVTLTVTDDHGISVTTERTLTVRPEDAYVYVEGPEHGQADPAFGKPGVTDEGTVVFSPLGSGQVGLYDPATDTYTGGPEHGEGRGAFYDATVTGDGAVVLTPLNAGHVGLYDPATDTYASGPEHGEGDSAFVAATRAADGRVVLAPMGSAHVGVYDPATGTYASGPEHGENGYSFAGATRLDDGRIVFAPHNSAHVGLYDPSTDTYTSGPEHGERDRAFTGAATTDDGRVVFSPLNSAHVGIYDPATDTYTSGPEHGEGEQAFSGAVVAADGTILFVPLQADQVGVYDPATDTYTRGPGHGIEEGTAFFGGTSTPDGNVVLSPHQSATVGIVRVPDTNDPPTATFAVADGPAVAGEPVALDATGSSDPDGSADALTYGWDLTGDGTTDATGAVVEHTFATPGSKSVTLTVTDGDGASDSVETTVTVGFEVEVDVTPNRPVDLVDCGGGSGDGAGAGAGRPSIGAGRGPDRAPTDAPGDGEDGSPGSGPGAGSPGGGPGGVPGRRPRSGPSPGGAPTAVGSDRCDVPVTIAGTAGFDPVADLDVGSLRFGAPALVDDGGGATPVHGEGHAASTSSFAGAVDDLEVHFPAGAAGFTADTERAKLVGRTGEGVPVVGTTRLSR